MSTNLMGLFKALHPHVLQPHIRWGQFLMLFTVSNERMQLLTETAPGFFRIVQDVLRDDAFISLSRLTDRSLVAGRTNLSLVALVEAAEASGDIPLSTSSRAILDKLLARVDSMRTWRNRWLAHIDLTEALAPKPLPMVGVKRGDIDNALDLTRQLMYIFADYLSQPRYDYQSVVLPGDAEAIVRALEAV